MQAYFLSNHVWENLLLWQTVRSRMLCLTVRDTRRRIHCLDRGKVLMKSNRLLSIVILLMLFSACGSRQLSQGTQSGRSSPQSEKQNISPSAAMPGNAGTEQGISYATNPERFVKAPTVAPPFNLTNPKTATDFFDVGVPEDNLHHYDKAIAAYEQGLKLKPDWPLLCLREAKDYQRLNQPNKAIEQLNR